MSFNSPWENPRHPWSNRTNPWMTYNHNPHNRGHPRGRGNPNWIRNPSYSGKWNNGKNFHNHRGQGRGWKRHSPFGDFMPPKPPSPLPGTEEYTQRNIQQTSDLIKKQLYVGNDEEECIFEEKHEPASVKLQENCGGSPEDTNQQKIAKKVKHINVKEVYDKIIKHLSSMSLSKKMNLVEQGSLEYDRVIREIQMQKRLELSRTLRNMSKDFEHRSADCDVINSIIPDIGIRIEDLPKEVIEQLSSTLNLDFDYQVDDMDVDPLDFEYLNTPQDKATLDSNYCDQILEMSNFDTNHSYLKLPGESSKKENSQKEKDAVAEIGSKEESPHSDEKNISLSEVNDTPSKNEYEFRIAHFMDSMGNNTSDLDAMPLQQTDFGVIKDQGSCPAESELPLEVVNFEDEGRINGRSRVDPWLVRPLEGRSYQRGKSREWQGNNRKQRRDRSQSRNSYRSNDDSDKRRDYGRPRPSRSPDQEPRWKPTDRKRCDYGKPKPLPSPDQEDRLKSAEQISERGKHTELSDASENCRKSYSKSPEPEVVKHSEKSSDGIIADAPDMQQAIRMTDFDRTSVPVVQNIKIEDGVVKSSTTNMRSFKIPKLSDRKEARNDVKITEELERESHKKHNKKRKRHKNKFKSVEEEEGSLPNKNFVVKEKETSETSDILVVKEKETSESRNKVVAKEEIPLETNDEIVEKEVEAFHSNDKVIVKKEEISKMIDKDTVNAEKLPESSDKVAKEEELKESNDKITVEKVKGKTEINSGIVTLDYVGNFDDASLDGEKFMIKDSISLIVDKLDEQQITPVEIEEETQMIAVTPSTNSPVFRSEDSSSLRASSPRKLWRSPGEKKLLPLDLPDIEVAPKETTSAQEEAENLIEDNRSANVVLKMGLIQQQCQSQGVNIYAGNPENTEKYIGKVNHNVSTVDQRKVKHLKRAMPKSKKMELQRQLEMTKLHEIPDRSLYTDPEEYHQAIVDKLRSTDDELRELENTRIAFQEKLKCIHEDNMRLFRLRERLYQELMPVPEKPGFKRKRKQKRASDNIEECYDTVMNEFTDELKHMGYGKVQTKYPEFSKKLVVRLINEDLNKLKESMNRVESADVLYEGWTGSILVVKVVDDVVMAGSDKGVLYFYQVNAPDMRGSLSLSSKALTSICVLPGKQGHNQLYIGSLDGSLFIVDLEAREVSRSISIQDSILCMEAAWGFIFIGSHSGNLIRFNVKKGKVEDDITISNTNILVLKAAQEGARRVLLMATRNSPVSVRDAMSGLLMRTMEGTLNPTVYTLLLHDNHVYCGTSQHDVLVYTFQDGQLVHKHEQSNMSGVVCMSIVKNLLFVGCYNGNIYVYNTASKQFVTSITGPGGLFLSMEVANDRIIAGTKQNQFKSWMLPECVLSQIRC